MTNREKPKVLWSTEEFIVREVGIPWNVAQILTGLFSNGSEVPFIARYRSHLIGEMTTDDLRFSFEAFNKAKIVEAKAKKLIERVDTLVQDPHQQENLKNDLSRTMDSYELDILFEPFKKTKNGTLAMQAIELGMDAICQRILRSENINLSAYVNPSNSKLDTVEKVERHTINLLSHYIHRMDRTQNLIKEIASSLYLPGVRISVKSWICKKAKALKPGDADFHLIDHFKDHSAYDKDVRAIMPFQILALERAASKDIVYWKVDVDQKIIYKHPCSRIPCHYNHRELAQKAVEDSSTRFLIPSIARNIRRRLLDRAENSAIDCFAKNLRQLLLSESIKESCVLAIDPGFTHGCKVALLNENSILLDSCIFHMQSRDRYDWHLDKCAQSVLTRVASKCPKSSLIIAIGDGKGSRHVQVGIAYMIRINAFSPLNVQFCVVSECGASVYSASPIAAEELPDVDLNIRSAVSLARRVINPISEYVKIAPKHLGVGSYQHSVSEKRLDQMLDIVVRECVSNVGVDLNSASLQLLQKVAGLNKTTAMNIVKYRQANGPIINRDVLKEIPGIGVKTFEQCAGFLFIRYQSNSDEPPAKRSKLSRQYNPFDSTSVHPESYHIATQLFQLANIDTLCIGSSTMIEQLLRVESVVRGKGREWIQVWELLTKPLLLHSPPQLLTEVRYLRSLKLGEVMEGTVKNHAQFGIFIDLGVGVDALAHHSCLPPILPMVNSVVKVVIDSIDSSRKRIGVRLF